MSGWIFATEQGAGRPIDRHLSDKWLTGAEKAAGVKRLVGRLWHRYRRAWRRRASTFRSRMSRRQAGGRTPKLCLPVVLVMHCRACVSSSLPASTARPAYGAGADARASARRDGAAPFCRCFAPITSAFGERNDIGFLSAVAVNFKASRASMFRHFSSSGSGSVRPLRSGCDPLAAFDQEQPRRRDSRNGETRFVVSTTRDAYCFAPVTSHH